MDAGPLGIAREQGQVDGAVLAERALHGLRVGHAPPDPGPDRAAGHVLDHGGQHGVAAVGGDQRVEVLVEGDELAVVDLGLRGEALGLLQQVAEHDEVVVGDADGRQGRRLRPPGSGARAGTRPLRRAGGCRPRSSCRRAAAPGTGW